MEVLAMSYGWTQLAAAVEMPPGQCGDGLPTEMSRVIAERTHGNPRSEWEVSRHCQSTRSAPIDSSRSLTKVPEPMPEEASHGWRRSRRLRVPAWVDLALLLDSTSVRATGTIPLTSSDSHVHHTASRLVGGRKTTGGSEGDAVGEVIHSYSVSGEYGCFSNFSPHPVKLKGKTWPTSEHYFQAQKFPGRPDEEEVRQAQSPRIAARMGRSRQRPLRTDWEAVKDSIMHEVVLTKFTQHADLREILLATGDAQIVEHTEKDKYWGDGGDGTGKNRLGLILMRVREGLRSQ
jgi:ribA/ribD-fused uncharacterized protein